MCLLELTACLLEDTGMPAGKLTYLANGNCTGRIDCVADLSQTPKADPLKGLYISVLKLSSPILGTTKHTLR